MKTNRIASVFLSALVLANAHARDSAEAEAEAEAFAKACAAAAAKELADGYQGMQGADPEWYFFDKELAHLGTGQFWKKDYATTTSSKSDPIPIIIDYHEKLKAIGVELLVVPVPPKATIYPEKFAEKGAPSPIAPFYEPLTEAGVSVIDLEPIFLAERKKNPDKKLYCAKDSHYSPYATQLIAKLIHEKYKDTGWAKAITSDIRFATGREKMITIDGDLLPDGKEKLPVIEAGSAANEQVHPDDPMSEIILLGDSHTMVFSIGDILHWKSAGLPDHLQAAFGTKIDATTNFGSGAHQARISLFQKGRATPGYWDDKKLLIWLFSAREFTQGSKWMKLPPKA